MNAAMTRIVCEACGANDWTEADTYRVCNFCGSKYQLLRGESEIALDDDVQRLLQKCRTDPARAGKYANLILDIDPTNKEARKYL